MAGLPGFDDAGGVGSGAGWAVGEEVAGDHLERIVEEKVEERLG